MSSDSVHRVTEYQTAGVNARLRLFDLLQAQGVPAAEADDLAVAGAQSEVVELDGMAPASQGARFADGWDEGVAAVSEALVGIADRDWVRRDGRSAGLLSWLYISRTSGGVNGPLWGGWRRSSGRPCCRNALEHHGVAALGEAGGVCTARTVEMSSDDVILCTRRGRAQRPGRPAGVHAREVGRGARRMAPRGRLSLK
ncbi:hypothetical protein ACFVY9_32775 [Streptomyces sp. NPDC059544]|uniref:hypothetical protein n=1 Tax=Streptomyces sp. NPDC059544 TaxID=3346861 RepID=UPI003678F0CD